MAMSRPALSVESVSRVHGAGDSAVWALREVDLTIRRGELVAVMGPSGSGKSTLLNLAGGLDRPSSGEVLVDGTSLGALSAKDLATLRRRKVGYVFQDFNLIQSLSAVENVALPLELDGRSAREARELALRSLAEVAVDGLADRMPQDMSGGQQQRVAIARAVIADRTLILADEPTGALDSVTGKEVMSVLRDRCSAGASVMLVTHNPTHADWADRVVLLRDGEVVDGTIPRADVESLRAES